MKPYPKINSIFKRDEKGKMLFNKFSLPEFEYLSNCIWLFTEKIDGTNISVYYDGENKVTFNGRTDKAEIPIFLLEKLKELFPVEKFKKYFDCPVCLYGEGYGNKIQKRGNLYLENDVNFILFDVFIGYYWLEVENIKDVSMKLNIDIVPIVGRGSLYYAIDVVNNNLISTFGSFEAEGLVLKPEVQLFNRKNERIITKIKGKDFN